MPSDFYSEKTITARKQHRCNICGITIEPGQKYVKKAGVYEGDFWNATECTECQPVIDEFLSTACGEDGYCDDNIQEWWVEEKCPNCKKYFPPCEPDGSCPVECGDRTQDGMCSAGDTCDKMTRRCWCEEYEPRYRTHITTGRETAYDLAEKHLGSRDEWESIEKLNGKWLYEMWDADAKKYRRGQSVRIPNPEQKGERENG